MNLKKKIYKNNSRNIPIHKKTHQNKNNMGFYCFRTNVVIYYRECRGSSFPYLNRLGKNNAHTTNRISPNNVKYVLHCEYEVCVCSMEDTVFTTLRSVKSPRSISTISSDRKRAYFLCKIIQIY